MDKTVLLTVPQASAVLGVSRQRVNTLIEEEKLKAFWLLERWAIPESEVLRYKTTRNGNTGGRGNKSKKRSPTVRS